ncbi:fibronectin type III domain-containing protein, partial [Virgisporangium aliadipatigenens]|uniref:fibronectin type III domain-containing protein n=1 Tax=Virgisporangium aliadipatigenens TaxID=741659 RepID=UPI001944EA20
PGAPKAVTVDRDTKDPTNIAIKWSTVEGATRYNVSVFDGATDKVTLIPGSKNTHTLQNTDPCARLRVTIGARDKSGAGATSGNVWLNSLAPGGVSGVKAQRDPTYTNLTVTWKQPTWTGQGTLTGYRVVLIRTTDEKTVSDTTVNTLSTTITKLDPTADYRLHVSATNTYGTCVVNKMPIGSSKTSAPTALRHDRDDTNPRKVTVTWNTPAYLGYGAITHYMIGAAEGSADPTTWTRLEPTTTSALLDLDPGKKWNIQIVPFNAFGPGRIGVTRLTPDATAGLKPLVNLALSGEQVNVKLGTKVGGITEYPRVVVRIRSLIADDNAYYDEQWGQTGASTITFTNIPLGIYIATVSGTTPTGDREEEWARQVMIVGPNTNTLTNTAWQSVLAIKSASGDGNVITKTGTNTPNHALLTTVNLKANRGYGVWVRASISPLKLMTGLLVEYDPNYNGQGPTYLLRMQKLGIPCAKPLAVAKAPTATTKAGTHDISVVANGDTLTATVDNVTVLNVQNLTATNNNTCLTHVPTGTQAGLRTWKTDGLNAYTKSTLR